jgi:Concanavalin A-like lectin/glucanases superfamily/Secretion system C-terminal sorting domain
MKKIICTISLLLAFSAIAIAQIPTLGLVGDWPFDGNANDYSGYGNNGVVYGATPTTDRFGIANHAYSFDGINDKIVVPHDPAIDMSDTSDFTISLWAEIDPSNMNSVLLAKHYTGYWNGYAFLGNNQQDPGYCTSSGHVAFYTASGAWQDACTDSPVVQGDTKWVFITGVHIAATNSIYIYINTVQQADVGQRAGTISNLEKLTFGAVDQCNCAFYTGSLDAIRIYRRALSQTEINQLYNETMTTSVHEPNANQPRISVFPNPNNGIFSIETSTDATMTIYNAQGQVLFSELIRTGTSPIDLTPYASGLYLIRVEKEHQMVYSQYVSRL